MDTDRFNERMGQLREAEEAIQAHPIFNAAREVVLQVADHYGIEHVHMIFRNRQRSSHGRVGLGSLVIFGYQDLEDAAANGYEEYPSLRDLLPDQTPTGVNAARWLGLHEAAHVVANSRHKDYIRPHGREFRQAYTELISLFA
jgi:hypothetical protein